MNSMTSNLIWFRPQQTRGFFSVPARAARQQNRCLWVLTSLCCASIDRISLEGHALPRFSMCVVTAFKWEVALSRCARPSHVHVGETLTFDLKLHTLRSCCWTLITHNFTVELLTTPSQIWLVWRGQPMEANRIIHRHHITQVFG